MGAIEVYYRAGRKDPAADALEQEIREDLGIREKLKIRTLVRYRLGESLEEAELQKIGKQLLADPLEQAFSLAPYSPGGCWEIVVSLNADVTDNVGTAAREAIADVLGKSISEVAPVRVDRKYLVEGELEEAEIRRICRDLLANEVIEQFTYHKNKVTAPEEANAEPGTPAEATNADTHTAGDMP